MGERGGGNLPGRGGLSRRGRRVSSAGTAGKGRLAALETLVAVDRGADTGPALSAALAAVDDARQRGLATELAYGVTRRRATLDDELAPLCRRPLAALQPEVRAALRMGLYQMRYLDRVPPYAAVASSVDLASCAAGRGAGALVNAVLRRVQREGPAAPAGSPPESAAAAPEDGHRLAGRNGAALPEEPAARLSVWHSHPEWLVRRWLDRLGESETTAMLRANNVAPAVTLRANRMRWGGADLLAALEREGIAARPGRWLSEAVTLPRGVAPHLLVPMREGLCTVQGEASMLVAHVADPPAGGLCLDVAAAPGGKCTHLAEWMGDRGVVVANDLRPMRAQMIARAASRLGLRCIRARSGDARDLPREFAEACDLVLADVPCSGLGTLAERADARWRRRPQDIPALAALAAELIAAAAACVRAGGRLVYSTCTTEPEENDAVVCDLLRRRSDFHREDLRPRLPQVLAQEVSPDGTLQLWPHRHGTGFFLASLRRAA